MAWFEPYERAAQSGAAMHVHFGDGGPCMCHPCTGARQRSIDAADPTLPGYIPQVDDAEDFAVDRSRDERIGL